MWIYYCCSNNRLQEKAMSFYLWRHYFVNIIEVFHRPRIPPFPITSTFVKIYSILLKTGICHPGGFYLRCATFLTRKKFFTFIFLIFTFLHKWIIIIFHFHRSHFYWHVSHFISFFLFHIYHVSLSYVSFSLSRYFRCAINRLPSMMSCFLINLKWCFG